MKPNQKLTQLLGRPFLLAAFPQLKEGLLARLQSDAAMFAGSQDHFQDFLLEFERQLNDKDSLVWTKKFNAALADRARERRGNALKRAEEETAMPIDGVVREILEGADQGAED
jgi:DNA-binding SARP family transcriptional activator